MYDLVSIGGATCDVFLTSSRFPLSPLMTGEKIEIDQLSMFSGGGGTNTAAGFSRLGLTTGCVARLGDDLFGDFVLKDLAVESFDRKYLLVRKGDRTDYATILVNPDGSRIVLVSRGQTCLETQDFPWSVLAETKWLYLASLEGNMELLAQVINQAYQKGVKIAFNPGRRELSQKEKLLEVFPKLEVLILNREEAEECGVRGGEALGPVMLVVTNGRQGAKLWTKERGLGIEAFNVPTVEETGAGDAFSTGLVAGLVKGWKLEESLKLGVANGASVVSYFGSKMGLLRQGEEGDWMRKRLRIEQLENF